MQVRWEFFVKSRHIRSLGKVVEIVSSGRLRLDCPDFAPHTLLIPIQCDESKPSCRRCELYGTLCDYDSLTSELQSAPHGVSSVNLLQRPVLSHSKMVLGIINSVTELSSSDSTSVSKQSIDDQYVFCAHDLDVLYRFHTRTILSLGPGSILEANQYVYSRLTYSVRERHPKTLLSS